MGLIPAHAGKTVCGRVCGFRVWAHPRACGENDTGGAHAAGGKGSSPRMRGKRASVKRHVDVFRLIPAHAGKTRRG